MPRAPRALRATHPDVAPAEPRLLFVSLELSLSRWLVTLLMPGRETMSKHSVTGGDGEALLALLARQRAQAERRCGGPVRIVTIQEAGLDGFWIHRLLQMHGVESHVVEPASIAVARRHRRAKTDAIDGEALLRTLMAYKRGEPRVCAMVVPPSPEEEDRRRLSRERQTLVAARIEHTNRIKGLLAAQGITTYQPLRPDCRERLEGLRTGDGRPLPLRLKAEINRALDRLALLQQQIAALEAERAAVLAADEAAAAPLARLLTLKSIGVEFASVLWLEGLFRRFRNRRQVAAYAGLAPSPWQSGSMSGEQGISKAGNPRLRTAMVELSWLWLRHQPDTALSRWFRQRVRGERGRVRRVGIVALARKLLVALWRFVTEGVVPDGAKLKAA
jgi:transposase